MAAVQGTAPAFFNDDTNFRDWVIAIRDALEDVGMVLTADTGQIDTAAVVTPPTINTSMGYNIFRFDDALQSTDPIFFKIEYGSGASSIGRPSLWMTTGTASNGSGTLSGNGFVRAQIPCAVTFTAGATKPFYACFVNGALCFINTLDSAIPNANAKMIIAIERPKDAANAPVGGGHFFWYHAGSSACEWHWIPSSGGIPTKVGEALFLGPGTGMVSKAGLEVGLMPATVFIAGVPHSIQFGFAYTLADIGELVTFEAVINGVTRTLLPLGDGVNGGSIVQIASPTPSIAVVFE